MSENRRGINWRAVFTLLALFSLLVLPFAGYAIHVMSGGSADQASFWGVSKLGWMSIHNVFGILFVIMMLIHYRNNWKALRRYLASKECLLALAVFIPLLTFLVIHGIYHG